MFLKIYQLAAISNGNKNQLRKNAFLKRISLNNEIVDSKSQKITEQLFKNFNFDHQNIHLSVICRNSIVKLGILFEPMKHG